MLSLKAMLGALLCAMTLVRSHMILNTPVPYGKPDNSPLDAQGTNFPCKGLSPEGGQVTEMQIGAPQLLSFTGGATHNGGSCQVSLTKDTHATKSSKWQVIYSIEGGCPSSAKDNLGGDPAGHGATNFTYTIPSGISAGPYTLAWTWFNNEGNREMYMNCANIKVAGGSAKRGMDNFPTNDTLLNERDASFPDMFVANIPESACRTPENADVLFPNPGPSVVKAGKNPLAAPNGPQCSAGPAAAGSGGGGGGASSAGSASSQGAASGSASGSSDSSSSGSGSSGNTGAGAGNAGSGSGAASPSPASSGSSSGAASGAAPVASAPAANTGSAPFANASSGTPSSAASDPSAAAAAPAPASQGASSSSCTAAGQMVCSPDGKQIAECGADLKVVWIPTAAGTVCKNGAMVAAKPKLARSAKFLRNWILNTAD